MGHRSLAEVLAGPPEPRHWDAICDLLDRDPELLEAALVGLEGWPDELREAPGHWLAAAVRGEDLPQLRIVRCIRPELALRFRLGREPYHTDAVSQHLRQLLLADPEAWAAILRSPHLADVRIIELLTTEAEARLRRELDPDVFVVARNPDPIDLENPIRRIMSLARSSLPNLHTLRLSGGAVPLPTPPTPPPKNRTEKVIRAFTKSPKSEWQRLLEGPGRTVEHWQLHGVKLDSEFFDAFTRTRGLARWRSLDLWPSGCTDSDVGRVLRLPVAATLESLRMFPHLRLHELADLRLPALEKLEFAYARELENYSLHLAGELFPALTQVALRTAPGHRISADRLTELLQPSLGARIERLQLSAHEDDVLASLAKRGLPKLSSLDVGAVDPVTFADFAGNSPRLECLAMLAVGLTADLAKCLGDLPLRELNLAVSGNEPMVEPLLRGAGRPERVHLRFHRGAHEGLLVKFARAEWLSGVRELRLSVSSGLDDPTLTALLESPELANLEVLELYAHASKATLAPLRRVARPPKLHSLGLSVASIEVDDARALASGPWSELEDIYLEGINLEHPQYNEARRRWLQTVPYAITQNAFAGPLPSHTRNHFLRMPPCPIVLHNVERSLRWGIDAEQFEDLHLRARSWPEPLRSELRASITAAARIDTDLR